MKMNLKTLGLFALLIVVVASCARKLPFTDEVRREYGLTDDILPKLQFYLSDDIILYRANSQAGMAIQNGEVIVHSTNEEDEVVIKKGTPGAFVTIPGDDRISVRFELGEKEFLVFSDKDTYKGRYHIVAKWERKRGVLKYSGEDYFVTVDSNSAYLMFKLKNLNKYKKRTRVATGVKVD